MSTEVPPFGSGRQNKWNYYQYGSATFPDRTRPSPTPGSMVDDVSEEVAGELFTNTTAIDVQYDDEHRPDDTDFRFEWTHRSLKRLMQFVGPGWLMSIAYIDSGNLESDIQAGALCGYSLLWILFWSTLIGWLIQSLCARLSVVTGKSLSELCRYEYSPSVSILIWIFVELSIVGNDIQQVIGTAIAFQILFGLKLWIGCILTVVTAFIMLAINSWKGLKCMEYFFLAVIASMSILFIVECGMVQPNFWLILKGWILPLINDSEDLAVQQQAMGIIGAVIMPFNLFLHSSLVQTRNIDRGSKYAIQEANFYFALEALLSLIISFFINLCVLSVFSRGFYQNPDFDAKDAGLLTAGYYLLERFGTAAKYVWALGLLASGQSATMTGTFAGQYVMNGFLDLKWKPWARTTMTRSIALCPALLVSTLGNNKFDVVNEWINVFESVILPFALLPLLFFNFNARIMGNAFVLGTKMKIFFSVVAVVVIVMNVYLICLFIVYWDTAEDATLSVLKWICLGLFLTIYCGFIGWLVYDFAKENTWIVKGDPELEPKLSKFASKKMHTINVGGIGKTKIKRKSSISGDGVDDDETAALLGRDLTGSYHE